MEHPMEWKNAYITPVYKGGSSDDPNNYIGISMLSCTAKLFNTILTKRLDTFLDSHKVISPMQIGFTKKTRTSDHTFVLRTLIENNIQNITRVSYIHAFLIFGKLSIE